MKLLSGVIFFVFVIANCVSAQEQGGNVKPQSDTAVMQTGVVDPFRTFIIFFPQDPKAPDAQMKIVSILMRHMRQSKTPTEADEAKRALFEIQKFLTLYPNNDFGTTAIQYQHELVSKLMEMDVPISGHIQDSGGKPIPNVKVTILYRIAKAVVSTTYSDAEGHFEISASGLTKEISEFGLHFEKEGFQQFQLNGEEMYANSAKLILYTPAEYSTAIGDFYFSAGNDIAAINRYEEAIKLQPDLRAANDGLGRSLERMGKYEQAVAAYQNFITRFPESPAVPEFKARILKIQNKKH